MKKLRIVFMGTPAFAVEQLRALLQSTHEIVGVVTAPDKPAGRGMQLMQSEVKKFALQKSLPVLQPVKLKDKQFIDDLKQWNADLYVVVAFRMLPEVVWDLPPLGSINLHASLLPQYRGAAPINWAIINGETETGVTTFFIQREIDTGKIIFQEKTPIAATENVGELYEKLMHMGASVLRKTVDAIAAGSYPQIEQAHIADIKHAPKIFKETCKINWEQPAEDVYNFIRGLSPYPAAYTFLSDKVFKIFAAEKSEPVAGILPGEFVTNGKTVLQFNCANGSILIKECQLEGKKRMSVEEFLRGNNLSSN